MSEQISAVRDYLLGLQDRICSGLAAEDGQENVEGRALGGHL